jgi:hypothetical protein
MTFRNVFSQIRCFCILAVICAGLSQYAAYELLDWLTAVRGEGRLQPGIVEGVLPVVSTALPDFKILVGSWKESATKIVSCSYPFTISYCILHNIRV